MGFEVSRRLSAADTVTLVNAVVGFVAGAVAFTDLHLAARLLLLSVITDALDGIVARGSQGSAVGPLLDSITDVVSFGATPSLFVYVLLTRYFGDITETGIAVGLAITLVASAYVVFSIVRTAFYETYIDSADGRPGMPNSLGAIVLSTAYLGGVRQPVVLAGAMLVFSVAMIAPFDYPKPGPRHVTPVGVVLAMAVLVPDALYRFGPRAVLVIALLFFLAGPRYYWAD
ncbi:protein sorting system archaetidylserine synthase [Halomicroarcula sp. GCM10025709]|uniref:protein sorting system archaetidylserine synthase n=1 Tax=Haloarcula TaxID=2237 RepID=UPI0024C3F56B|nr:protein sorting system archaetidylserine synthase [Halomicroarcula sp. YJ-61-S]